MTLRTAQGATLNRGLNVKDAPYNLGNSGVDAYTAIVAALTDAPNGSTVYIPSGAHDLGSNTLTLPEKKLKIVAGDAYQGGATELTSSALFTIDTTAEAAGTGASAWTALEGFKIENTATNGTGLRIQNGGVNLKDVYVDATGSGSVAVECTQAYAQSWQDVTLSAIGAAVLDCQPDGTSSGQEGLNNNTFTNVRILGGNTATWGIKMLPGTSPGIMRSNTFVGLDIEQTVNGITMDGENNVFVGPNIESTTVSVTETAASANTYISPESWVSGQSTSISNQSEVIPGVGSEGVYRQLALGAALDIPIKGIRFPATGSEITSTDPRILDHYGEGDDTTVTAVCGTSGTITLDAAGDGISWTRIGRQISFMGLITVDSVSSPTGGLSIQGLPYAAHTPNAFRGAVNIAAAGLSAGATEGLQATIQGDANIYITRNVNGTDTNDVAGFVNAATELFISGTYFVED